MKNSVFKILGYTKDYIVNNRLIGTIVLDTPDRTIYGYGGKRKEVLTEDVVLKNKKIIKKGTEVTTELLPICGRTAVTFFGSKKKND